MTKNQNDSLSRLDTSIEEANSKSGLNQPK